jgi:hypothetical protein
MMTLLVIVLFSCFAGLFSSGCGGSSPYNTPPPPSRYQEGNLNQGSNGSLQQGGRAVITDRTGKSWDVTHAQQYGLVPDGYQYGLGPYAILPLMDPQMLTPEDQGYPDDFAEFAVLGASINGFTRAYPTWSVMSSFEVANEQFGDAHVAVAF